jgi:putative peptide maturation dehydrogenase
VKVAGREEAVAVSPLTRVEHPVSGALLAGLAGLSSADWIPLDEAAARLGVDAPEILALAERGLLIADSPDEPFARLRAAEERLAADRWDPYAVFGHFLSRWQGVEYLAGFAETGPEQADPQSPQAYVDRHGPPPPHFHEVAGLGEIGESVELPLAEPEGALFDLLRRRRTCRGFDTARPLPLEPFSHLLRWSFGCHGVLSLTPELALLKKTSPSGGALHPIEVYPLVRDVEGLAPGLYHYSVRDHALTPIAQRTAEQMAELAVRLTAGQTYFAGAHALFVLTARFGRNFWKYHRHPRAYRVVLMDAAHLSQTFYLVAAELGLGAFFTAGINDIDAEQELGLDGFAEGAVAICGCGVPGRAGEGLTFEPAPYVPRA